MPSDAETHPLPSGVVTFAFTDVVGSTRAFVEHGEAFVEALTELHRRTAAAAERRGGVVVSTEGDGAFLAFGDAVSAVEALSELQAELTSTPTRPLALSLRAGAHTGEAMPVGGNYVALAVNVAARVAAAANAGQLLVTDAVVEALRATRWEHTGQSLDMGTYALKDLAESLRIWRLAGDATPPRAAPARRTNVQQPRTSFVGRGEDLERLRRLVDQPGHVTVVGPGGVGKTRLVSELAVADAEEFPGGTWLVEMASLDSADQVVGALGAALRISTRRLADVEAELVRRGRCVLVLDNCDHLVDAAAEVVDRLVAKCEQVTVLCTSREPLRIPGERVWRLSPLSPSDAAVTLFLHRVGARDDRELDLDQVRVLCAALDGLPLAIELAAGHADSAHLDELIDAVASGTDTLVRRGGEARQRSLDAILDWSLARLNAPLLDSLLVLSVFPGRFSPAMARSLLQTVPSCDPSAARALAARSLIDLDGEDYRMLATIRAAARRRCAADPRLQQHADDALVAWTAAYGAERYDILTYQEDVPADTLLAVEAGLIRSVDSGRTGVGKAWHLMSQCVNVRGAGSAMVAAASRALQRDHSDLDADDVLVLAAAVIIGSLAGGDACLSPAHAEAMLAAARAAGDPVLLERSLDALAASEEKRGDLAAALSCSLEALRLAEEHPEVRHRLPAALNNVGAGFARLEDTVRARPYYERAIEAADRVGNVVSFSIAHENLAELALLEGRPGDTLDHVLTALRSAPPQWRLRGYALGHLARAHAALGDRDAAVAAAREALPLLWSLAQRDPVGQTEVDLLLAAVPEVGG